MHYLQPTTAMAAMTNLPVPVDQFLVQPQSPNLANPVFSTSVSNDPAIVPYSQQITWSLANEIVGSVTRTQANALRVFSYNLYSQSGFNNQEFFALAQLVAGRVRLAMMRQEYPNIESAISVLVPETVTIVIGANARRFDALLRYCTPDQQQHALGAANRYDNIAIDVNRANNGHLAQPQPMGGMVTGQTNTIPTYQPANVGNGGNVFAGIGNTGVVSSQEAVPQVRDVSQMSALERQAYETTIEQSQRAKDAISNNHLLTQYVPASAASNLSGQYSANPVVTAPNNCTTVHVGSNAPDISPVSAEEHARQVAAAFAPAPVQEEVSTMNEPIAYNFSRVEIKNTLDDVQCARTVSTEQDGKTSYIITIGGTKHQIKTAYEYGEVKWAPSAIQPFHPYVSLNIQHLFYVELVTGEIIAMVKDLKEGKYHMNYDEHAVYANYRDQPPAMPNGKPQEKPKYNELEIPKMKVFTHSQPQNYFSVESAVVESLLHAVGRFKESANEELKPLGSTYETRVLTPILFDTPDLAFQVSEELKNISGCANFAAAAESLEDIVDPRVRKTVDRFITQRLVEAFKFELSVTYNAIDSFLEDHAGLLKVINDSYPGAIAETFNSHQQRILRSACYVADASRLENAHEYFQLNPDDAAELLTRTLFVARNVSIVIGNFNDSELCSFFTEESCAVLETTHPHLRELINRGVSPKSVSAKALTQVYLVTKDGYRYKAAVSMVANGAILLRRD